MILNALVQYYERLSSGDHDVATEGFEKKEIPFLIIINRDGKFIDFQDTRISEGKKKIGKVCTVPKSVKKTSGIAANLLWESPSYILGKPRIDPKKNLDRQVFRAKEQHKEFCSLILDKFSEGFDEGTDAVIKFLERRNFEQLFSHSLWKEIEEAGAVMSFQLVGDKNLICEREKVVSLLKGTEKKTGGESICLITGNSDVHVKLHTAIKGVWGAQTSGANIVSFNLSAFRSFNKEQGDNAPVGENAEFAYTTALNTLLKKGSKQRIQVGDASTVFWAERKHDIEDVFADIFGEPAKDNPTQDYKSLIATFRAPEIGSRPELDPNVKFYILGLAPNAARIAVRFWYEGTVGQVADNITRHFDDCSIVHGPFQPDTLSLFRLLVATAVQGESKNIQPKLGGEVMRSILAGIPYPKTILPAVINRIKAEQSKKDQNGRPAANVTYPRAAIIKAVLVRESRFYKKTEKEVGMALDKSIDNIGYRLGRLFATLEKAQEEANPGINATIRDRFYSSAASAPVTAFPYLMKLKNHHISKLDSKGRAIYFERLIGEIISEIKDFPSNLQLADQGRFAVGYYHQRNDFFTKNEN